MQPNGDPQRPSWELPEALGQRMEPLIPATRGKTGHPRTADLRRITEGIFYVLRTGIQWQACPRERFGPPSTVYYYCAQWVKAGIFARLWVEALTVYDDLKGLEWTWQSVDGAVTKAPLGGSHGRQSHGPWQARDQAQCANRRAGDSAGRRGRGGQSPRHEAVGRDARGGRDRAAGADGRNAAAFVCRKGDDYAECREEAARQEYIAHIRSRGEERQEKQAILDYRARRWVVGVCHSWCNRFRKILVRFEKKLATYLALLQLACAYIVLKRAEVFR
jgi:putative transposase